MGAKKMFNKLLFSGLVFSGLLLQCQCARVKHSEFESLRTPDDSAASWPSPDQVYFKLGEQLNGEEFAAS